LCRSIAGEAFEHEKCQGVSPQGTGRAAASLLVGYRRATPATRGSPLPGREMRAREAEG
jgi:hypothetical protein